MSGASHSNVARRFYKFCEPRELDFLRFLKSGPQRPTVGDEGRSGERGLVSRTAAGNGALWSRWLVKKKVITTVLDIVVMCSDNGEGKHKGGRSENGNILNQFSIAVLLFL